MIIRFPPLPEYKGPHPQVEAWPQTADTVRLARVETSLVMNEPVPSLERFPSDRNMKYRYGLIALAIMVLIGIGAVGAFQIRQVVSRQSLFRVHRTSYYSIAAPYEWRASWKKNGPTLLLKDPANRSVVSCTGIRLAVGESLSDHVAQFRRLASASSPESPNRVLARGETVIGGRPAMRIDCVQ